MRTEFFFVIFLLAWAQAKGDELLKGRGFESGQCYRHLAQVKCEKDNCSLMLFKDSSGRLSISLQRKPAGVSTHPNSWYMASFQIISKKIPKSAKAPADELYKAQMETLIPYPRQWAISNQKFEGVVANHTDCRK